MKTGDGKRADQNGLTTDMPDSIPVLFKPTNPVVMKGSARCIEDSYNIYVYTTLDTFETKIVWT